MLEIRLLNKLYAPALLELLLNATEEDKRFFTPFVFEISQIESRLEQATRDRYYGIFQKGNCLCGYYMLRGLDEGYDSPMYGVFIHPEHRHLGLGKLTLSHAVSFCRMNQHPSILLGVHPENAVAINTYRKFGFSELRSNSQRIEMELKLA